MASTPLAVEDLDNVDIDGAWLASARQVRGAFALRRGVMPSTSSPAELILSLPGEAGRFVAVTGRGDVLLGRTGEEGVALEGLSTPLSPIAPRSILSATVTGGPAPRHYILSVYSQVSGNPLHHEAHLALVTPAGITPWQTGADAGWGAAVREVPPCLRDAPLCRLNVVAGVDLPTSLPPLDPAWSAADVTAMAWNGHTFFRGLSGGSIERWVKNANKWSKCPGENVVSDATFLSPRNGDTGLVIASGDLLVVSADSRRDKQRLLAGARSAAWHGAGCLLVGDTEGRLFIVEIVGTENLRARWREAARILRDSQVDSGERWRWAAEVPEFVRARVALALDVDGGTAPIAVIGELPALHPALADEIGRGVEGSVPTTVPREDLIALGHRLYVVLGREFQRVLEARCPHIWVPQPDSAPIGDGWRRDGAGHPLARRTLIDLVTAEPAPLVVTQVGVYTLAGAPVVMAAVAAALPVQGVGLLLRSPVHPDRSSAWRWWRASGASGTADLGLGAEPLAARYAPTSATLYILVSTGLKSWVERLPVVAGGVGDVSQEPGEFGAGLRTGAFVEHEGGVAVALAMHGEASVVVHPANRSAPIRLPVDAVVTALAARKDRLFVGTRGGLVYAFVGLRPAWRWQADGAIEGLSPAPDGMTVAVRATRDLALLDEGGQRVWRDRRRSAGGMRVVTSGDDLVLMEERTGAWWRLVRDTRPPAADDSSATAVRHRQRATVVEAASYPDDRAAIAERSLARAAWRDLVAVARTVSGSAGAISCPRLLSELTRRAGPKTGALIATAAELRDQDAPLTALAELARHWPETLAPPVDRLARLWVPGERLSTWAALEILALWVRHMAPTLLASPLDVLFEAEALPPALVSQLLVLSGDPFLRVIGRLAAMAAAPRDAGAAGMEAAAEELRAAVPGERVRALAALLRLAGSTPPRWDDALALIAGAQEFTTGRDGAIPRLLKAVVVRLPPHPPDTTWRASREQDWVRGALGQTVGWPVDTGGGWAKLMAWLAGRLDERLRDLFAARLVEVAGRTRLRIIDAELANEAGRRVIRGSIEYDGFPTLTAVDAALRLEVGARNDTREFHWAHILPGDPPEPFRFPVPSGSRPPYRLTLEARSGVTGDEASIVFGEAAMRHGAPAASLKLPDRVIRRVSQEWIRPPAVTIVGYASNVDPTALGASLAGAGSYVVDLADRLREYGEGAMRPLSTSSLLNVALGRRADDERMREGRGTLPRDIERVILIADGAFAGRSISSADPSAWAGLDQWPEAGRPALVVVVPWKAALTIRCRLGGAAGFASLGHVTPEERSAMPLPPGWTAAAAQKRLKAFGGDVRALFEVLPTNEPTPTDVLRWAREDVAGLSAAAQILAWFRVAPRKGRAAGKSRRLRGDEIAQLLALFEGAEIGAEAELTRAGWLNPTTGDLVIARSAMLATYHRLRPDLGLLDLIPEDERWANFSVAGLRTASPASARFLGFQISPTPLRAVGNVWASLGAGRRPSDADLAATLNLLGITPIPDAGPRGDLTFFEGAVVRRAHCAGRALAVVCATTPPALQAVEDIRRAAAEEPIVVLTTARQLFTNLEGPDVAILGEAEIRSLLATTDRAAALLGQLAVGGGLVRLSPFVVGGALPADSVVFTGRAEHLRAFEAHMGQWNWLLLGARRIGKTSLLLRMHRAAVARGELAIYADVAGLGAPALLVRPLRKGLAAANVSAPDGLDPLALVEYASDAARDRGKRALFFLNEIDALLLARPDAPRGHEEFFQRLRSLGEAPGGPRFHFVAYASGEAALRDPDAPLFQMTSGVQGRGLRLGGLPDSEALELTSWLERPPLALSWASPSHRDRGQTILVRASAGVPWLLQQLCQDLVVRLERDRRGVVRLDDVRAVTEEASPVLRYVDREIDLGRLLAVAEPTRRDDALARLFLLAMADVVYFRTGRVDEPNLDQLDPAALSFAPDEMGRAAEAAAERTGTLTHRPALQALIRSVNTRRFLERLALTLLVAFDDRPARESDKKTSDTRWYFQGHLYPRELRRAERRGEVSVSRRILEALRSLELHG